MIRRITYKMKVENIEILKNGGVGIIPTDTVYGIVCSAFSQKALSRLYEIKGRDEDKPPVVLISALDDLKLFGIDPKEVTKIFTCPSEVSERRRIKKFWPGKVSIIFNIKPELNYLDKGRGLAIRWPADKKVLEFLKQTGPLATSSANIQGQPPAKNISEAKKYFGNNVDFYEAGGDLESLPSTLVDLRDGQVKILREGEVKIY